MPNQVPEEVKEQRNQDDERISREWRNARDVAGMETRFVFHQKRRRRETECVRDDEGRAEHEAPDAADAPGRLEVGR